MTNTQVAKTVDVVKAWAFPTLLLVVGFFLTNFYFQQGKILDSIQEIRINQSEMNGKIETIDSKIANEKEWREALFKSQIQKHN